MIRPMATRLLLGTALMCGWTATLRAQGFGPPDPAMIFNFVDRNQDGRLDRDEIDNSRGPLRDRLREAGIDYSRGLSRDDFVRQMERSRSSEGERGGGERGGFDPRSFDREREEERRSEESRGRDEGRSDDRGSSSRSSGSSSSKPQPKVRVTLDLQQTFKEGDRDGDGQIGLYEWRQWKGRALGEEFARLDLNGDGFVTPREIERAGTAPASAAVVVATVASPGSASPASASAVQTQRAPAVAPPAATVTAVATPAATVTAVAAPPNPAIAAIVIDEANPNVRRYRSQFSLLDRDRSGKITPDEWERSTNIRGRLAEAKANLTEPMDADTFVRNLLFLDGQTAAATSTGS